MDERFSRLKTELKTALSSHYKQLVDTVPDIYGYSLYSEDGVFSIGAVANRASEIPVDPTDRLYNYYRYGTVEWSEWDNFGLFDAVNSILRELHDDESTEFDDMRETVLQVSLEAMCELEAEGLFGPKTDERFVVICLSDSGDPIMLESAKRLNTPAVFEAYASEFA